MELTITIKASDANQNVKDDALDILKEAILNVMEDELGISIQALQIIAEDETGTDNLMWSK